MLSIGKLAARHQDYYLHAVAAGVEDYYLGSGEAPGRWLGPGAARLELSRQGRRGGADGGVRRSCHGSDKALTRARTASAPPGWDLTFSAPKSVSLLYALGPPALRQLVVAGA